MYINRILTPKKSRFLFQKTNTRSSVDRHVRPRLANQPIADVRLVYTRQVLTGSQRATNVKLFGHGGWYTLPNRRTVRQPTDRLLHIKYKYNLLVCLLNLGALPSNCKIVVTSMFQVILGNITHLCRQMMIIFLVSNILVMWVGKVTTISLDSKYKPNSIIE